MSTSDPAWHISITIYYGARKPSFSYCNREKKRKKKKKKERKRKKKSSA